MISKSIIIIFIIILIILLCFYCIGEKLFSKTNNFSAIDPAQRFRLDRTYEYTRNYDNADKPLFQYNNQAYNVGHTYTQERFDPEGPSSIPNPLKEVVDETNDLSADDKGVATLTSKDNIIAMVKSPNANPERAAVMKNWKNPKDIFNNTDIEDPDLNYYHFESNAFNPPYAYNNPIPGKLYPESYYSEQGLNNISQIARSYYKSRRFPEFPNVRYMYENSYDGSRSFTNNRRYGIPARDSYGRTAITGVDKF
ncbi:MAG: hypothetical protein KIT69_12820 [Propionibacteriaceae bacterium]|nr:hypothetical protein [Propionibacteriaceae bacterium]